MSNFIREALTKEEVIRIQRKAKLTNGELAEVCDVDDVTISRWKAGASTCKGKYAKRLLELVPDFEFDIREFTGEVDIKINFKELRIKNNSVDYDEVSNINTQENFGINIVIK